MPDAQFVRGTALLRGAWDTVSRIAKNGGPEWRKEYLAARRTFMEAVAVITAALGRMETDPLQNEARAQMRALTTTLALHQADWPVVSILLDDPAYVASMRKVQESLTAFLQQAARIEAR